jgi:hypothetical protein
MRPITFAEQTGILAENQPEYLPLPVHIDNEDNIVTSCWELTDDEIATINKTKKLWIQILTFGQVLQPQLPLVDNPLCQKQ